MKRILISPRLDFVAHIEEERVSLDTRWFEFLQICGLHFAVANYTSDNFKNVDGIILSGGNDLSDLTYSIQNKKRDDYEKKLVQYAVKKSIPVLGVCRGAQHLAYMYGSSLSAVENHVRVEHKLIKKFKSKLLGSVLNHDNVNSFHDFAISELGSDLKTLAACEDNTIEAFEHKNHKILGILWHPERVKSYCDADVELITRFFEI